MILPTTRWSRWSSVTTTAATPKSTKPKTYRFNRGVGVKNLHRKLVERRLLSVYNRRVETNTGNATENGDVSVFFIDKKQFNELCYI